MSRVDHLSCALIAVTALSAAAVSAQVADDGWQRLETVDSYTESVGGKVAHLRGDDTAFLTRSDGGFDGEIRGEPWAGEWAMRKGMVCYQGKLSGVEPTYGCAKAYVRNEVLRLDFALNIGTLYYDLETRP